MSKVLSEDRKKVLMEARRRRLKESSDDYPLVVARIGDDGRIIRCPDDLQFIAQRRSLRKGMPEWKGFWFFATIAGARRLHSPEAEALFDPETGQIASHIVNLLSRLGR